MGLEGITYDSRSKKFIVVQQTQPMEVYEVDMENGRTSRRMDSVGDVNNFADVYRRSGDSGLYILSSKDEKVVYTDERGRVEKSLTLGNMRMPEGLTFNKGGDVMVVVGEPNEINIYSTGSCNRRADNRKYRRRMLLGDEVVPRHKQGFMAFMDLTLTETTGNLTNNLPLIQKVCGDLRSFDRCMCRSVSLLFRA